MRRNAVFASLALAALSAALPALAAKPDVVLISLDTFRADRLAAWGGEPSLCPELNAAAARGAAFTRCTAPAPVTLPSHATLLTGCFPSRTGLHDNGMGSLVRGIPTLAEGMKSGGYATRAIVASSVLDDRYGLSRGFDLYDDGVGRDMRRNASEVTDRALDALKAKKGPTFLFVHYFDAHEPYLFPDAYAAKRPGDRYDSAVAYLDAEVGRLLKALGQDTLVAVVADHGEGLGDHGESTHGALLFQSTVAVPLILFGPGVPPGKTFDAPCSLADVAPTLARFTGLSWGAKPDGLDLSPALAGRALPSRSFPIESWLPYYQFRWLPLTGITDGRFKWVRGKSLRLYDLKEDPAEARDLAAKPPAAALPLKSLLPPLPDRAAASSTVDASLRGLGYTPVPTAGGKLAGLPDPHDGMALMRSLDDGRAQRARGDFAAASATFGGVVAKDPKNPTAQFELGEALRRAGDFSGATAALERALALAPAMPEALTSRGMVSYAGGKEDAAVPYFERALKADPTMVLALNPLAAYYLSKNQPTKALPLLDGAISRGFANADTYLLQMRVHLVQNQREAADKDFREAMSITADPPATLKAAADIFVVRDMMAQAMKLYEEGIRLYPDFAPNYLTLGGILVQSEKLERALAIYKKARELDLPPATRQHVEEMIQGLEEAFSTPGP